MVEERNTMVATMSKYNQLILGNGFDLMHGLKTKYMDFLTWNLAPVNNWLVEYIKTTGDAQTWVDIETEIAYVIESIERMRESIEFDSNNIGLAYGKFIRSHKDADFLNYINKKIFHLEFSNNYLYISADWYEILIGEFDRAYKELVEKFNIYLFRDVESKILNPSDETKEKMCIPGLSKLVHESNKIFTFNYTSTIALYLDKIEDILDIGFLHGRIADELVFGIAPLKSLHTQFSSNYYKSTLSTLNNADTYDFYKDVINDFDCFEFTFVGYSFAENDHYIFNDLKKIVENIDDKSRVKIVYYYYVEEEKKQFIYNLREFLGEYLLIELNNSGSIRLLSQTVLY